MHQVDADTIDPGNELDRALACPLCGYDLRGLPAGRCPECGHAFDPEGLRRVERETHPYLFEFHPKRFWWSLPRTILGTFRPGRFWRTLRPEMPVQSRALFAFTLVVMGLLSFSAFYETISDIIEITRENLEHRAEIKKEYQRYSPSRKSQVDRQHGRAYASYLAMWFPVPTEREFWRLTWSRGVLSASLPAMIVTCGWPILTLATLLIFRQSLRQARIQTGHLVRCCIYAAPLLLLALPVSLALLTFFEARQLRFLNVAVYDVRVSQVLHLPPAVLAALVLGLVSAGWSLWRAFSRYLRFPHAAATVVASQIMVWLTLAVILSILPARW